MTEIEFEALKKDFIDKNHQHIEALKKLSLQDLRHIGTKSTIAILRTRAILSYQTLSNQMFDVQVQLGRANRILV